jgi:hypothetical protein
MGDVLDGVIAYLDSIDFDYERVDDDAVRFGYAGECAAFTVVSIEDYRDLQVRCYFDGARVPAARRAAVAELMRRCNARMRLGAYHLDHDDGKLLFAIGSTSVGMQPARDAFEHLLGAAVTLSDEFSCPLMGVCFGERSLTRGPSGSLPVRLHGMVPESTCPHDSP